MNEINDSDLLSEAAIVCVSILIVAVVCLITWVTS